MSERNIVDFLVNNGAQPVHHAGMIQSGATIVVLPNEREKKSWKTRDILFTIIQTPPTARYIEQRDVPGIFYMDMVCGSLDTICSDNSLIQRETHLRIVHITSTMVDEGLVYHLPRSCRMYKFMQIVPRS